MALIPVRHLPDPVLRERTRRVTSITPAIHKLVEDMIETMHAEHGVGIAANQVGSVLRIAVIEIPREVDEEGNETGGERYVLINPEIIRRVGERRVQEGCLSVPGWRGELTRSLRVTAKALDLHGREYRIKADGLLAQALEHETDHLNGTVYLDRMDRIDDLWALVPAGEEPATREDAPNPDAVWRLRRPATPVVRRG